MAFTTDGRQFAQVDTWVIFYVGEAGDRVNLVEQRPRHGAAEICPQGVVLNAHHLHSNAVDRVHVMSASIVAVAHQDTNHILVVAIIARPKLGCGRTALKGENAVLPIRRPPSDMVLAPTDGVLAHTHRL